MDRTDEYERAKKNPIFGTDLSKPVSVLTEEVRKKLTDIRGMVSDIRRAFPYASRLDNIDGFLTTGISSLCHDVEEFRNMEIRWDDDKRGPSLSFHTRGVGMDACQQCFVCGAGGGLMHNVAAFVRSKEDGEKIVDWFDGGARLDFRQSEPNWIQVKIGACESHREWLHALCVKTSVQQVIRELDIKELRSLPGGMMPATKVLCVNCLRVRPYTDSRHIGVDRCECGGEFCGCSDCVETANALESGQLGDMPGLQSPVLSWSAENGAVHDTLVEKP